jgi:hypothetical protein
MQSDGLDTDAGLPELNFQLLFLFHLRISGREAGLQAERIQGMYYWFLVAQ